MTLRQMTRFTAAVLAGAALLIPARATAQGVTYGVKGGLNVSNVTLTFPVSPGVTVSPKSKNGVIIGGFVGKDFNAKGGIQAEFLFAQGGSKVEITDGFDRFTDDIRVNYIEIPVLGRFNLKASDQFMVHVFAGPVFAFKTSLSEKQSFNGIEEPIRPGDEFDAKGQNVGITLGGQVDLGRFLVDLRYTWGLMNINDRPSSTTNGEQPEVKTREFAVMFGVKLGKK